MNSEPFRVEPTFSPRLWGARSLAPLYPDKSNLAEPIGEAWLSDVQCRIATGSFTGITPADAPREMPAERRGTTVPPTREFSLPSKIFFSTRQTSLPGPPHRAYAAAHAKTAGGRGPAG